MSHVFAAVAALLFTATPAAASRQHLPPTASFQEYANFFERDYDHGSGEGLLRRALFEERASEIRRQNEKPGALWSAGFNSFTDWTHGELKSLRGWRATAAHGHPSLGLLEEPGAHTAEAPKLPRNFPESQDWMSLKSLEVPDQGPCGSCWAIAATFLLRSHYEIHSNNTRDFAIQEFVNCVENPNECGGTGGCNGATVELAMAHAKKISLEDFALSSDVPYTARDGECAMNSRGSLRGVRRHGGAEVRLVSSATLRSNQPIPLLRALLQGPVAVSAAASQWFSYVHGVFDGCSGPEGWIIDHAVLMVGFGVDARTDAKYWKIMNSWGTSWGEDGTLRLLRLAPERELKNCGWDLKPQDGIECKPYPEKVYACGTCGILYDSVTPTMAAIA